VADVARFNPDVLVVLGGGVLPDDRANCATTQRAVAALQLFQALGMRPAIVLSGWGQRRRPALLDDASSYCLSARLAQQSTASGDHESALERERLLASHRGSLHEADLLCATMLRRLPPVAWRDFLLHVRFEARSETTTENAAFSTPVLERGGYRRVLIVSTPVVRPVPPLVDNHPARALADFRVDRERTGGHYQLAAAGCPFVDGGPAWFGTDASSTR
jgi:hypothetical protein